MFEAIGRGEVKALWVMGTNPAVSLPDADAARAALKKLELFVISENVRSNDTVNAGAHVLLPAQAWGEKSGTVTNSERRISRQRAFLTPAGEAKHVAEHAAGDRYDGRQRRPLRVRRQARNGLSVREHSGTPLDAGSARESSRIWMPRSRTLTPPRDW